MRLHAHLFFIICWLWVAICSGQANFRAGFEQANPVVEDAELPLGEKVKAHQLFLKKAIQEGVPLNQLYGQLFFVSDYIYSQDYTQAAEYLLKADSIAKAADDPGWQGWVNFRKGALSVRLKDYKEALQYYESAASLCGHAQDSLCLAESMEQIGIMYGMLDDFDKAETIHKNALALLEKFGGDGQMATALNNFGIICSLQKRLAEAIPYFERAIGLYRKINKPKGEAKALNNLADIYRKLKDYDQAIEKFEECVRYNKEHNFLENLVQNYVGMGLTYETMKNFEAALYYFDKHEILKDSLMGMETQRKIAELQIKYETQQKELELEKSKLALKSAQFRIKQRTAIIFFILFIGGVGLWRWQSQTHQAKKELQNNQENLKNLTRLLLDKNRQLMAISERLEDKLTEETKSSPPENLGESFFNQTILTDEDWTTFKVHFEKGYPGYMLRLRNSFQSLTEAEERLFLFIKLNLNTKESATLLGISPDSIKKTRNRLRKRLDLDRNTGLDVFVQSF